VFYTVAHDINLESIPPTQQNLWRILNYSSQCCLSVSKAVVRKFPSQQFDLFIDEHLQIETLMAITIKIMQKCRGERGYTKQWVE
jgi:hypothetical protein